jgi:hypothetical protein
MYRDQLIICSRSVAKPARALFASSVFPKSDLVREGSYDPIHVERKVVCLFPNFIDGVMNQQYFEV